MPAETYEAKRDRIAATIYTDEQLEAMPWNGVESGYNTHGEHVGDDSRGHCPHCGINLDNGYCDYESMLDTSKSEARKMVREFVCLACNGEYGPTLNHKAAPDVTAEKRTAKPIGAVVPKVNGKSFGLIDEKGQWLLAAPSKRPGYPTPLRLFRTEASAATAAELLNS